MRGKGSAQRPVAWRLDERWKRTGRRSRGFHPDIDDVDSERTRICPRRHRRVSLRERSILKAFTEIIVG